MSPSSRLPSTPAIIVTEEQLFDEGRRPWPAVEVVEKSYGSVTGKLSGNGTGEKASLGSKVERKEGGEDFNTQAMEIPYSGLFSWVGIFVEKLARSLEIIFVVLSFMAILS